MSNEWGAWIVWNGGECPVAGDATVWIRTMGGEGWMNKNPVSASAVDWYVTGHPGDVIAYRVKKEPVVEVKRETARVELYGSIPKEIVNNAFYHGLLVTRDLECTYTDGKLTKIHWEAE